MWVVFLYVGSSCWRPLSVDNMSMVINFIIYRHIGYSFNLLPRTSLYNNLMFMFLLCRLPCILAYLHLLMICLNLHRAHLILPGNLAIYNFANCGF